MKNAKIFSGKRGKDINQSAKAVIDQVIARADPQAAQESKNQFELAGGQNNKDKDFEAPSSQEHLRSSIPYMLIIENSTDVVQKIKLLGNLYKKPKHKEGVILSMYYKSISYDDFLGQIASSPFIGGKIRMEVIKGDFDKIKKYASVMKVVYKDADGSRSDDPIVLNIDPYQVQEKILEVREDFVVNAQTVLKFKLPPESSIVYYIYPVMFIATGQRLKLHDNPHPIIHKLEGLGVAEDRSTSPYVQKYTPLTDKTVEIIITDPVNKMSYRRDGQNVTYKGILTLMEPVSENENQEIPPTENIGKVSIRKKTVVSKKKTAIKRK